MMMLAMVMLSMKLVILTSIASLHGSTRYEILVTNPNVGSMCLWILYNLVQRVNILIYNKMFIVGQSTMGNWSLRVYSNYKHYIQKLDHELGTQNKMDIMMTWLTKYLGLNRSMKHIAIVNHVDPFVEDYFINSQMDVIW